MVELIHGEIGMVPNFIEKPLVGSKPPRCVDGRPSSDSAHGPQMLGGSLHPLLLESIFSGSDLDANRVSVVLQALHKSGVKTGAHRGEHAHEETSDCGFADKMRDIVATAIAKRELVSRRLQEVFKANQNMFHSDFTSFRGLLNNAYNLIEAYSPGKIKLAGEALVKKVEDSNSKIETVDGDHAEQVAFVNLKDNATLDTVGLNLQGQQGFNLDLPEAAKQASKLGVPESFSIPASLILYQTTEIVLVENKGKPPLPVEINS